MNTKISDAAVEAARRALYFASSPKATAADYVEDSLNEPEDAEDVKAWLRAAIEAALPHLGGEAVPVAYIEHSADQLSQMTMTLDGLALGIGRHPVYTHPQPAALNEVSGNSGELAEQQGADALLREVCAELDALDCGACTGSMAPMEDLHGRIADYLAATGKQAGEAQGTARAQFEAWAASTGWYAVASRPDKDAPYALNAVQFAWEAWQAALAARQPVGQTFQAGVSEWMGKCFLPSLYSNMIERGDRLLEEVLELLQAHGYDQGRVATLVDYVFNRPVGVPAQEVGGVMVTLAGYCWVAGLDMHAAGDAELQRIKQPEVMDKIRRKQEAKNALHFDTPLPGDPTANVEVWPREGDLVRYGDGSSALAIRLGPHAGGWHGYQCCGGYTFFTKAYRPSRADMDTWLDCAKHRDERTKVADSRVAHEMYLIDSQRGAAGVFP